MTKLSQKEQEIIAILLKKGAISSSDVHELLPDFSLVTIKRALSALAKGEYLAIEGSGPSTIYEVAQLGRIFADIDAHAYCAEEPDKRYGLKNFNFDLLNAFPENLFTDTELLALDNATTTYHQRTTNVPESIQKKELERLIIELSWKSSKIEGNTYTLLDTEKLILENKEASGHDHQEARMILNHKDAFTFVHDNATEFVGLTRANLEKLHSILIKDLNVGTGLRSRAVGVLGSAYQPLSTGFQIDEAITALHYAIEKATTPYAKALLALLCISYIQPFEDGNKRTSRLMANALLLAHGCAPLSYRSIDENEYRETMLVFYELNSIMPFKKIFVAQYEFGATNYAVK